MHRDGANKSLWQDAMPVYKPKHKIIPEQVVDVLVVGGGITGLSTALALQKAGQLVLVIESHTIGFGTTGGTTAHLNTFLDTTYDHIERDFGEKGAQLVFQATSEAIESIRKNTEEYNIDCGFGYKDGYVFAQNKDQAEALEKLVQASRKAGMEIHYTDDLPIPVPFEKAASFTKQAQFHPTRYLYGIAEALENAGGMIVQQCRAEHFESNVLTEVRTNLGVIRARKLIFATHIPPSINLLHFRCAPYRSYALALKLNDGNYPDALVYDMYDPFRYYRTQEADGQKYLVIGGEDHKTGHNDNTDFCFSKLDSYASKYYDIEEVSFKWSSEYFEPADGLPYIGHLPGFADNVFVATGFSGNGMVYSHVAALLLRDLITTGQNPFQHVFDPNRIKPVAGFSNFVKENADVVREFIGKRLSKEKIESLVEVGKGEGKVVKYEGESIALYRDDRGTLHAVNPVCTHAKCIVQWNNSEKSWDCPCHGARYTADGKVLTGPASKDLEIVELKDLVKVE
ncbi:MAG: FAD-dependent oxidoreductase [Chitinophagaceae bacterium]|jgi:glycine/D-amino acid oxidase-like deaminating enzyme/nitrite reductase/ring-hydroxylating ferredoxin subunit|nr:FAD-dependent oxidoreductase [Chitinophagaceae bacterium]